MTAKKGEADVTAKTIEANETVTAKTVEADETVAAKNSRSGRSPKQEKRTRP